MRKILLLLPITFILTSCEDDGTGYSLILSLFISFWLGMIPVGIIMWLFAMLNGEKKPREDINMTVFTIACVVVGWMIKSFLF